MQTVQGVVVPSLMYGTAWKEERTEALTLLALREGFRAIDTANQRKHYVEAGVGAAWKATGLPREQLFLQTKFTYQRGQDHRLPYDPKASLREQVRQSFERSLEHLQTQYIDSLVLHGPWSNVGWTAEDTEVWTAMEQLQREGRVRLLGVSNISKEQLVRLCEHEKTVPAFVQNRCYARTQWDASVRAVCKEKGIVYQGFSLLTANRKELQSASLAAIATREKATVAQVIFRFAQAVGMLPLTGTSDREHMQQDLAAESVSLHEDEVRWIEGIGR